MHIVNQQFETDVFRNEILEAGHLSAWQKEKEIKKQKEGSLQTNFVELILISEITNSEVRITSKLTYFDRLTDCQDLISKNLYCVIN